MVLRIYLYIHHLIRIYTLFRKKCALIMDKSLKARHVFHSFCSNSPPCVLPLLIFNRSSLLQQQHCLFFSALGFAHYPIIGRTLEEFTLHKGDHPQDGSRKSMKLMCKTFLMYCKTTAYTGPILISLPLHMPSRPNWWITGGKHVIPPSVRTSYRPRSVGDNALG